MENTACVSWELNNFNKRIKLFLLLVFIVMYMIVTINKDCADS